MHYQITGRIDKLTETSPRSDEIHALGNFNGRLAMLNIIGVGYYASTECSRPTFHI